MVTIKRINPNNRNTMPGLGMENNIYVKAGDFNPLVDIVNSISPLYIPTEAQQALSGPGVISVLTYYTALTTTGTGDALTLAVGSKEGQLKKILYVAEGAAGDTAILTPSITTGFATCTFNAVGDYAVFQFNGTYWVCIENFGCTLA